MKKKFNQAEYINQYKKDTYKRYTVEIRKELTKDIDEIKTKYNLSNRELFLKGYEFYKNKVEK